MTDPREALVEWERVAYGETWDALVPEVGRTVGQIVTSTIDAFLAAGWTQPGDDPRKVAHIECDCVPDLGPSHCHLCSERRGAPVPWGEAHRTLPSVEDLAREIRAQIESDEALLPESAQAIFWPNVDAAAKRVLALFEKGEGRG